MNFFKLNTSEPAILMGLVFMLLNLPNAAFAMGQMSFSMNTTYNSTSASSEVVCPNPGSVTTYAEIQALTECEVINGRLTITNFTGENLLALRNLKRVTGNFSIHNAENLTSVVGLNGLESVGGLSLRDNPSLTSLVGFRALTTIDNDLRISSNTALENIGLGALTSVGGTISIYSQRLLGNLSGLANVSHVGGDIKIQYSTLGSIGAFQQLTHMDGSFYVAHSTIDQLDGFDNLVEAAQLAFRWCTLNSFEAFGSLERLTAPNGSQLPWGGSWRAGFWLQDVRGLSNLEGLNQLRSIAGSLLLLRNRRIQSFTGLNNLESIGDSLIIYNDRRLTDLTGLESLQSVKRIEIGTNNTSSDASRHEDNRRLTSLSGLDNLTSVEQIRILDNENLADISALQPISPIKDTFVRLNDSLPTCQLAYLEALTVESFSQTGNGSDTTDLCPSMCVGDYAITEPSDFDDIAECEIVVGNLEVSNLANLSQFSSLEIVTGDFTVADSNMETLSGLTNLRAVLGELTLDNLSQVADLNGLSSLVRLAKFNVTESMTSLQDLTGIYGITLDAGTRTRIDAPQLTWCDLADLLDNCYGRYWGETTFDGRWHPAGHSFGEHEMSWSDLQRLRNGCLDTPAAP